MKSVKKIILALGFLLSMIPLAKAQEVPASKVPADVTAAFAKAYPGVKATWEIENGNYEGSYMKNGLENSVFYTPAGKIVKFETGIKPSSLPVAATEYIKKNFSGKKIDEAAKVTTPSGEITYSVVIKGTGKATIFDKNGKYLKTIKDL